MKKLEKRVERELVDILYLIIKSDPPSIIKVGYGLEIMISKVMNPEYLFPLHTILIAKGSILLLQTTLIINPYEKGYTIQYLNFSKEMMHGLKKKRWLVERVKKLKRLKGK